MRRTVVTDRKDQVLILLVVVLFFTSSSYVYALPEQPQWVGLIGDEPGPQPGGFLSPHGIRANASSILVTDSGTGRVEIFNKATDSLQGMFFIPPSGFPAANNYTDIDQDRTAANPSFKHIYVVDSANSRILEFDGSGNFFGCQFGTPNDSIVADKTHPLSKPSTILVNGTHILVGDAGHNVIRIYKLPTAATSCDETYQATRGNSTAGFIPSGIAYSGSGHGATLFVSDVGNHVIQSFTSDGDPPTQIGGANLVKPRFLDSNGTHLFVSDTGFNRIAVFTTGGTFVSASSIDNTKTPLGQFFPRGIVADYSNGRNNIYVADLKYQHIVEFNFTRGGPVNSLPAAVQNVQVTPQNGAISLSWIVPFNTGGQNPTEYTIKYLTGVFATPTVIHFTTFSAYMQGQTLTQTISGLTNGQPLFFKIFVKNGVGVGQGAHGLANSTAGTPVLNPTPGFMFIAPPNLPDSISLSNLAKLGFTGSALPSGGLVSTTNFSPFDKSLAGQNVMFNRTITFNSTIFKNLSIQPYSPPQTGWDTSHVYQVPPYIANLQGGVGAAIFNSIASAPPGQPLFLSGSGAPPLSNGGAFKGIKFALAGITGTNLNVTSQFLPSAFSGDQSPPNAAMFLSFNFTDKGGDNFGSQGTFSAPPVVSFTLAPKSATKPDPGAPTNIISGAACPLLVLNQVSGGGSSITITATRDTAGDTATVCGYDAAVPHFSDYDVETTATIGGDVVALNPPSLSGYGPNQYPMTINSNNLSYPTSSSATAHVTVNTGAVTTLTMLVYDASGSNSIAHVGLHTNISDTQVTDASDTAILWQAGQPLTLVDPHGFFSKVTVTPSNNGNMLQLTFNIVFAKPMPKSAIVVRTWDTSTNSWDYEFPSAWQAVSGPTVSASQLTPLTPTTPATTPTTPATTPTTPATTPTTPATTTPQSQQVPSQAPPAPQSSDMLAAIKDWGGYSQNPITDSKLLQDMNINAQHIPQWVAKTAKFVVDGSISADDFKSSVQYLYSQHIVK